MDFYFCSSNTNYKSLFIVIKKMAYLKKRTVFPSDMYTHLAKIKTNLKVGIFFIFNYTVFKKGKTLVQNFVTNSLESIL